MTDEDFDNAPKLFADIGFGEAEANHPETGEPVTMGYFGIHHNGQWVVCLLCKSMVEEIGKAMTKAASNITFETEIVHDAAQKEGNEHHVN